MTSSIAGWKTGNLGSLCNIEGLVQQRLVEEMNALEQPTHLVDGFPMPVCNTPAPPEAIAFKAKRGIATARQKTKNTTVLKVTF